MSVSAALRVDFRTCISSILEKLESRVDCLSCSFSTVSCCKRVDSSTVLHWDLRRASFSADSFLISSSLYESSWIDRSNSSA
jgi:hypothetical protein